MLMKIRTEQVLRELSSTSFNFTQEDRDPVPFPFDARRFAFHKDGVLYLTLPDDFETISDTITVFNDAEKQTNSGMDKLMGRLQNALKKGDGGYMFSPRDSKLLEQIRQENPRAYISKTLASLESVPLSQQDIIPLQGKEALPITPEDISDFEYLLRPSTRLEVKELLGVDIDQLSGREKFYFFSFLKKQETSDVPELRRFIRAYGLDGVRSFLTLENDAAFAHEIVWTGNLLLEGVMTDGDPFFSDILRSYVEIIESADRARELLRFFCDRC